MKSKTKLAKLCGVLLALVMIVGMLPATALAKETTVATESPDFVHDSEVAIALLNAHKTPGAKDSTWDSATKTLTLNGVNFVTTDYTGMTLPAGTTIVLNGVNTITGGDSSLECCGIYGYGYFYVEGTGILRVTAGNSSGSRSIGILATGIVVNGGEIIATGGSASSTSYGILDSNALAINSGKVTATGGTATGSSIGVKQVYMYGGSLVATGNDKAVEKEPNLDSTDYPTYWWRTSSNGNYTDSSTTPYTYTSTDKYVEFRDTEPAAYTVSFDANGGIGAMADVVRDYGLYCLPENSFTAPDGKYFNGWALSPDGSVLSTEIYNITANTTFYAIWEDIKNIDSIAATITEPVLGKTPDYDPVYTSNPADGVEIVDIIWYKIAAEDFTGTDEDSWKTVSSSEEFATGYYYSVDMYFITKEHFAISESTTGTVNGKPHDSTYFNIYVHTYKAYLCAVFEPLNVVTPVTGLKITPASSSSLTLSWDKNDSATGYLIQQYKNGTWTHVRQLARNTVTSYTATGLSPSTTYQYRVRAYYTSGSTTTYSKYTTISGTTKPSNMTGLKATSTANTITFSWDKNDTATGYLIQQYKNGEWTHIRQLARNNVLSYTATGLTPSTTYQYRIRAYYTNGSTTTYSDYKYVSPTTRPSNLTGVKATSTANTVTLSWDKNDSATGYFVQQYKNGAWTHVRQLARNTVLSYTATGLTPSTTYQFRIRAYYTNGTSTTYSDYKYVSPTTRPSNMTGVKVTSTSNTVTLSWNKNDTATGYFIQQYKDGKWTHIRQLARNTVLSYTATGLTPSTNYQFRIRAYYTNGSTTTYSDYKTVSCKTTS